MNQIQVSEEPQLAALLPKHQGAIPPDSKLGVLNPAAVLHQPAVAHHVAQTLACSSFEEACILGIETSRILSGVLYCGPPIHPAATRPTRLQDREGPQRVMDHRHVTWDTAE